MTGYTFTGTISTTYLGTSNVTCAIGYSGVPTPTKVACEDTGTWTAVNGCTIKGNNCVFLLKRQRLCLKTAEYNLVTTKPLNNFVCNCLKLKILYQICYYMNLLIWKTDIVVSKQLSDKPFSASL